jgi:MoaA/NifB/PqqE/SkfB family radical SAM enzyme
MRNIPYRAFEREFLENAMKHAIPVNAMFELTPLCNLDCKMCYVHLQDPSVKNRLLSGDQWTSIMDRAFDLGMFSALLTGGEALTHPDFFRIYHHLTDRGICVSLKSNGILLNDEALDHFRKVPPTTLDVSIYGCDDESCRAVTGRGIFETVDRNLRAALDADMPLRLMITPSSHMLPWIEKILRYAASFGVETRVNVYLAEPYNNTGRKKEDFDLTADQVMEILRMAGKILPDAGQAGMDDDEAPEEKAGSVSAIDRGFLRCAAGRTRFAVSWEGIMTPCLQFPKEMISENVLEHGVAEAWKNVHARTIALCAPAECADCDIREECVWCPVKHGHAAPEGRCDPRMCELEKRMADLWREKENAH